MAATVVILGAGIGGLVAAHELRRRLERRHRIVLVDREAEHRFQASYLWVMMGWRKPAQITRSLSPLREKGIEFRQAAVEAIDPSGRTIRTDNGSLSYDYLVVALGAALATDETPALAAAGLTPYTLDGAQRLHSAWRELDGGSVAVVIADLPFRCPAAPYETALLLDTGFRKRGVRDRVTLSLFTPEPQPMPVAGPAVGQALQSILEERRIAYTLDAKLANVDPQSRQLEFQDGSRAGFDLLVYVPAHRSPTPVGESSLAGAGGWIPVDARTLRTGADNVYAIGDVAAIKLSNGMMLPKAGVFAHEEAAVVARRIAAEIEGKEAAAEFGGWGACFVEIGGGKAAYGSGNFLQDPEPAMTLEPPTRSWHMNKVLFEKAWLAAIAARPSVSAQAFRAMDLWQRTAQGQRWLWRWL